MTSLTFLSIGKFPGISKEADAISSRFINFVKPLLNTIAGFLPTEGRAER
jgi:hypothetical protein